VKSGWLRPSTAAASCIVTFGEDTDAIVPAW
jgi:hypothetical protein